MIKETVPKPGFYSRDYNKIDTETKKPCKKVGFSQIKRVSKEDTKMEMESYKEEKLLSIGEGCHSYAMRKPGKKIIVLRKKKQPNENGKSEPDNKGSNNK